MASSCSERVAKEAKRESTREPNWLKLPRDLTLNIFKRLYAVEIVERVCLVCPLWWNICKDPFLWRSINMSNIHDTRFYLDELEQICYYAVGRSCGQLEEIRIESFATDDLLEYITDRARHLRRVRLIGCVQISNQAFYEFFEKLPMLEELDISHSYLTIAKLQAIGQSCPLLKSLKSRQIFIRNTRYDDEAYAIARNIPGLRRLNIYGNQLTNDALHAILDGCPLLEFLDLRDCGNLYFGLKLRKECFEHIKHVRFPSMNYYYIWEDTPIEYLNGWLLPGP